MTKFENKPAAGIITHESVKAYLESISINLTGQPMTFKPRDDDRTKIEILDLPNVTLTALQISKIEAKYPELLGKKV